MYTVYILKCSDGSLYTGIAKDLSKRLQVHISGKGSKYVKTRLPFQLIYSEQHPDRSTSSKRESQIKSWSRQEKISNLKLKLT